jgi:pimeloyl-ACP methyl ester carboxylesterase
MRPEQWPRARTILELAASRPPGERVRCISECCPDDLELRTEIESLLGLYGDTADLDALRKSSVPPPHATGVESVHAGPTLTDGDASTRTDQTRGETKEWGDFVLLEELGRGGFGVVHRAWDSGLKRDVALKLIDALRLGGTAGDRILYEGQLLARVNHDHVVRVFSAKRIGNEVGLAMELIKGRTLWSLIAEQGPLNAPEAALVGISLCDALAAVHHIGLIHRDVKPSNVMRENGGRIVLMDFGAGVERATGAGGIQEIVGTPAYTAPEVLFGAEATPASDIYSLGVLLFYLVTARHPVQGRGFDQIRDAHLRGVQLSLDECRLDLPARFVNIIERALSRDPTGRYRTPQQFKHELSDAMPGLTHDEETERTSVVSVPETRYARSGDVNIAYQVVGAGPRDLVFIMGWVTHLDYFWAEPTFARFLRRLARFSRLILIDKRGTGLSDRVTALPTLEQRMDDVRAVMEQVGSSYAALLGVSEGGPMCALFAATYPEKTRALVMIGTYAKRLWDPEYPWGPTREAREAFYRQIQEGWGGPIGLEERAPSMAADPAFRAWWATYLRMGASPGAALALTRMNAEIDIRDILPSIRVPTLVLHRRHDRCLKVEEGRYVSSRIPGAVFVELPGEDHLPFVGDQDLLLDEIERFVTGAPVRAPRDRVLATILHTRAEGAAVGAFLEHAARECDWFRGRALEIAVGRFVAAFDGPARAIRCAAALTEAASRFNVQVHVGLHTGECTIEQGSASGPPVNLAACIAARAGAGETLVSRTVCDIVGDAGFPFEDRGIHQIPGFGEWRLFGV